MIARPDGPSRRSDADGRSRRGGRSGARLGSQTTGGTGRFTARESGFTLVELMVAMSMAIVIFGATLDVILVGLRDQTEQGQRAQATQLGTAMVERMTRQIREASQATVENAAGNPATTGGRLDLQTPVPPSSGGGLSSTQRVVYDCTAASQCTRAQGTVGGVLGTAAPVIGQVANGSTVFSGTNSAGPQATNPTFIELTLDQTLGAPFSNPLELQDGIALRDLTP